MKNCNKGVLFVCVYARVRACLCRKLGSLKIQENSLTRLLFSNSSILLLTAEMTRNVSV